MAPTRRETVLGLIPASLMVGAYGGPAISGTVQEKGVNADLAGYVDEDKFFGPSFVDIDEWRDEPIRYRYIHGGFSGTDTRFSIYLPPKDQYRGRMIQFLQGGTGGSEFTSIPAMRPANARAQEGGGNEIARGRERRSHTRLDHAFDLGAFLVESNQGHIGTDLSGLKGEFNVSHYRASAATARFAKFAAQRLLGATPHHSYVYGGSGGGIRTINCVESTVGVWDGAAPFVIPHQDAGTCFVSLVANAVRVLGRRGIARLEDAMEVGGAGKPFAGLTVEQARVLADLYRAGWPRQSSLRNLQEMALVWPLIAYAIEQDDPDYYKLFWTERGFAGFDTPEALAKDRLSFQTRVARVLTAGELAAMPDTDGPIDEWGLGSTIRATALSFPPDRPIAVELEGAGPSPGKLFGATIRCADGAAAGRVVYAEGSYGRVVYVGGVGGKLFEDVRPGDRLELNNDQFIAYCHYYQHFVEPQFPEFGAQVCDGEPIYPQRPRLGSTTSGLYTFRPRCKKMIITQSLIDRGAWPMGAVTYREHLSPEFGQRNLRIYITDQAQHGPPQLIEGGTNLVPVATTTHVDYTGCVESAVRSLIDWVERGVEPPAETRYAISRDRYVTLPDSAAERRGLQSVVKVTANGHAGRVEVARGAPVKFDAALEMPPNCGAIVSIEWDFDGKGAFPVSESAPPRFTAGTLSTRRSYPEPGTYFACARVTAQRDGNPDSPLYRAINLGRIRVVVS